VRPSARAVGERRNLREESVPGRFPSGSAVRYLDMASVHSAGLRLSNGRRISSVSTLGDLRHDSCGQHGGNASSVVITVQPIQRIVWVPLLVQAVP
jgi:hypothetical protein